MAVQFKIFHSLNPKAYLLKGILVKEDQFSRSVPLVHGGASDDHAIVWTEAAVGHLEAAEQLVGYVDRLLEAANVPELESVIAAAGGYVMVVVAEADG